MRTSVRGLASAQSLDSEGSISIRAEAVISKNNDGTISVKQGEGDFPVRTVSGTAIGSLIGLLGGPVGLAVGALTHRVQISSGFDTAGCPRSSIIARSAKLVTFQIISF